MMPLMSCSSGGDHKSEMVFGAILVTMKSSGGLAGAIKDRKNNIKIEKKILFFAFFCTKSLSIHF